MESVEGYKKLFRTSEQVYLSFLEKRTQLFRRADECEINGPSLYLILNVSDFRYAFVGKAFESLLGFSRDKIVDGGIQFIMSLMHPTEKNVLINMVWFDLLEYANTLSPRFDLKTLHFQLSYRLRHAAGHYLQIQETQMPVMICNDSHVVLGSSRIESVCCPSVLPVCGRILSLSKAGSYEEIFFKDYSIQQYAEVLTKRELDVAKCLAKGMSSKEIGQILFLSSHTIDTYRRRILKKLNLVSTSQLWQ